MRILDALDEFLLQLEANGRSRHTIEQYRRHVALFAGWVAPEEELAQFDSTALARFLASPAAREAHRGQARRASTLNAIRGSLKGFGAYLHAAGRLPSDPARMIRRARCGKPPPAFLTAEEQASLLKVLRRDDGAMGRDYALIHTLLATGLRIGSALALRVEDVNCRKGEAVVRRAKGDRPTVVVLSREIVEHFGWFIGDRTKGPLFTAQGGDSISTRHANRIVKHWAARAGLTSTPSPHTLRHSFGMRVYLATGDLLVTQAALGHASIMSTTVYARADRKRLRAVLGAS